MGLLAVDEQYGRLYLVGVVEDGLVEERLAARCIPAVGGVAAALVVTALGLIIRVVIFHKPGSSLWQWVNDTASAFVRAVLEVLSTLGSHRLTCLHALFFRVTAHEVALAVHLRHVVHGRSDSSFYAGVEGGSVDSHTAKAADADNADTLRINVILH